VTRVRTAVRPTLAALAASAVRPALAALAASAVRTTLAALAASAMLAAFAALPAPVAAAPRPPSLSAKSAIVIDASSGDVLYARAANLKRPIASTTKLMTALVALEHLAPGEVLSVPPYRAAPAESTIGLRPGERMTVRDLLRALLLPSANDAAVTLAEGVTRSRVRFVRAMNRRARQLHLRHTHYSNPVGLDVGRNYSSAADLVTLVRRLRTHPFFRHTTNLPKANLRSGDHLRTVVNRNDLVARYRFVNGVKTGHTNEAGYVLVGSGARRGVTVISAALGDPTETARDADTLALLNYGLASLKRIAPVKRGERLATARLRYRESDAVPLVAGRTVREVVRRGRRARVAVDAPAVVQGPKPAGARVGTATVRVGGRVVARVPVVTAAAVPEVGLVERVFGGTAGLVVAALAVLAVATGSVLLAMSRRRRRHSEQVGPTRQGVGAA
jgi:serine-type D-Ala-D-Ala carboxypeptidase (penicillin-binding protein 5/6)